MNNKTHKKICEENENSLKKHANITVIKKPMHKNTSRSQNGQLLHTASHPRWISQTTPLWPHSSPSISHLCCRSTSSWHHPRTHTQSPQPRLPEKKWKKNIDSLCSSKQGLLGRRLVAHPRGQSHTPHWRGNTTVALGHGRWRHATILVGLGLGHWRQTDRSPRPKGAVVHIRRGGGGGALASAHHGVDYWQAGERRHG